MYTADSTWMEVTALIADRVDDFDLVVRHDRAPGTPFVNQIDESETLELVEVPTYVLDVSIDDAGEAAHARRSMLGDHPDQLEVLRGGHTCQRRFVGNVAHKVLRRSPVPVIVGR